ncbi:protein TRI1 [Eurytemora carolleeae]|uniref:protein TRI1 n=1 Tax=Eurytemora carolleeae TaxID=1294199 RepID=UPI000C759EF7|nr:protein TRI1 [Eurytemora carolleeae]XP_023349363.1 protein TRI1 [Eurytemora carolleeae]|eukprot:XP_023349362.1 protein TRI1-like [Eurytemora affinis]
MPRAPKQPKVVKEPVEGAAPKKPSGLTKPMKLSAELSAIVGAGKDEKLARSEVVKRLWAYLKEKKLQDPENKQFFTPDALMEPVFGNEKIRAFSMSKYLKDHLS